jgi:hypothetical protein
VAFCFDSRFEFSVVVYFAVIAYAEAPVRTFHGLMTGLGGINDAQSSMSKTAEIPVVDPYALVIGPTMLHALGHGLTEPFEVFGGQVSTQIKKASYATHRIIGVRSVIMKDQQENAVSQYGFFRAYV